MTTMTTITNPTPEQTAAIYCNNAILGAMTDAQARAVGLLLQALESERDEWDFGTDGLDADHRDHERLGETGVLGRNPWVLVYKGSDIVNALAVEINEDGLMCALDYEGYTAGRTWSRVDGADITGLLSAAWRAEFGS